MIDAAARALFEEYKSRGFSLVEEQLKTKAEEGENLDFKLCNSDGANLHKEDKKNFAELASAFANTSGGVLVWGVNCRKNEDDIDVVTELKPIAKVAAFRSALRTNAPSLLQPGLNGIDFHIILLPHETDVGFLAVFIPSAQGEPVRAEAAKTYRYHIRTGDQSPVMPHSILADRFGRRPHPRLELRWWRSAIGTGAGGVQDITLTVAICNVGLGLARYPAARLQRVEGLIINPHSNDYMLASQSFRLNPISEGPELSWNGKPGFVIQPGIHLEITTVTIRIPIGTTSVDFELPYVLLCEGDHHEGTMKGVTGQIAGGIVYKDERKDDDDEPILVEDD